MPPTTLISTRKRKNAFAASKKNAPAIANKKVLVAPKKKKA